MCIRDSPSWFPLVPSDWGIGASPQRLIRTPVQGGYPWYHSILSPPIEGLLSWSPYPYIYLLPCHQNFANYLCVFSVCIYMQNLYA